MSIFPLDIQCSKLKKKYFNMFVQAECGIEGLYFLLYSYISNDMSIFWFEKSKYIWTVLGVITVKWPFCVHFGPQIKFFLLNHIFTCLCDAL